MISLKNLGLFASNDIKEAVAHIVRSETVIALTGAGISVESGIPDFRSPGGIWEKFEPMEYAHIDSFRSDPEKVWKMLVELQGMVGDAKPNQAHNSLAEMEEIGRLQAIITQNIDNLHQDAGSKKVIEFHGNCKRLICLSCGNIIPAELAVKNNEIPPRCSSCNAIMKPDVIFFGEAIPQEALDESMSLAGRAGTILVVGTSATVAPASSIPLLAKRSGAVVIEINLTPTLLTDNVTDVFLQGKASEILPKLVKGLRKAK
jgi:NAD-dependent protein deacetylase/lipoamidase